MRNSTPRPDALDLPDRNYSDELVDTPGEPGTTGSNPRGEGFSRDNTQAFLRNVVTSPAPLDRMVTTPDKDNRGTSENMIQAKVNPLRREDDENRETAIIMPKPNSPVVLFKRSKLEIAFLIFSTTVSPVGVAWTSALLTMQNPNANAFDVAVSGAANGMMLSTFGNRSVQFVKEFMKLDRADKAIALSLLAPSAITTAAAYQLFRDSLKNAGYSDVVWGLLLVPNLYYALTTCYMSLWNLYKRSRTFVLHQKNKRWGSDEVKLFEQFKEMLEVHARELNRAELGLTDDASSTEVINAVEREMLSHCIPVGRSAGQNTIYAVKVAAIVTTMPIVLAVIPPNFLRLTQSGLGGIPDIGPILSSYSWLVCIAMLGRAAIYVTAVLDDPDNTEKALVGIADRIQKINMLAKMPVLLKTALSFVISAGLVAAYNYAINDSGLGLSGETLVAMNGTMVRNNTAFPYPSGFNSAANETFFAFWPTLALFYYVNLLFHAAKMTELSAGLIANGNSGLGLLNGWFSKQAEGMPLWKAILAFSVGVYADSARKATPLEKFTAKLESATAAWTVKLEGQDLVTASGTVSHDEVQIALNALKAKNKQSPGCLARTRCCFLRKNNPRGDESNSLLNNGGSINNNDSRHFVNA
ncbi:MAG: hypothetical protein COY58_00665 [Gammaproteobacteria bacterium CG_4_10_14_0_8_um_filter_38_16]|nr:MAG: hypothetical protein COY58_00665 [Gammaproteobacteria bacterium CG_4_10_14_0_8_um_filter_38_16]PJA04311.1 MAG: hypothetical protein COX72_00595 [Gammaproteobacteria bacterium CG_4_10_14_0_2_um_filter_38_22]PJB10065.1 MAG: hypothetical protein CO120_06605 [Gammaproteobacteria bacterium CG_4_9_14_3_um_filter_38_9]